MLSVMFVMRNFIVLILMSEMNIFQHIFVNIFPLSLKVFSVR